MKAEEKERIRELINREIDTLDKSITTLLELSDSEVQSDANDWFSSKESNISKDINDQALAKAKQKVVMLNRVLKRIDNPGFGVCVSCGKEIPFERMKAVPTAIRCMKCK